MKQLSKREILIISVSFLIIFGLIGSYIYFEKPFSSGSLSVYEYLTKFYGAPTKDGVKLVSVRQLTTNCLTAYFEIDNDTRSTIICNKNATSSEFAIFNPSGNATHYIGKYYFYYPGGKNFGLEDQENINIVISGMMRRIINFVEV